MIWNDLQRFGTIWTYLDPLGSIWTNLDPFRPISTNLDTFEAIGTGEIIVLCTIYRSKEGSVPSGKSPLGQPIYVNSLFCFNVNI